MGTTLVLIGIGCIIAGIVGGGITLHNLSMPSVTSLWRQGLLVAFGAFLSLTGALLSDNGESDGSSVPLSGGDVTNNLQGDNSETANAEDAGASSNTADNGIVADDGSNDVSNDVSNAAGSSDVSPQ